ncbi:MAG: hypothetical protein GX453_05775 [Lactococcus chungangensis]|uniref:Transposase n=2 Tax=Lactobacillales TaxID=186826 RepID=A0ABD7BXT0_LACPA|nr:hypothetical protein [Lactococcus chungangensis]QOP57136.1 hypothetical protein HCJ88_15220 [Lacticaseibacillus paracasei]
MHHAFDGYFAFSPFKFAARVVHTGRRIQLRLSSHHVYHRLFYQALQRIQAIE